MRLKEFYSLRPASSLNFGKKRSAVASTTKYGALKKAKQDLQGGKSEEMNGARE